jgi:hypothetical protein
MVFAHLKALTNEENKKRGQALMKEMNQSQSQMFGGSSPKKQNPQAKRSTRALENDEIGTRLLNHIRAGT